MTPIFENPAENSSKRRQGQENRSGPFYCYEQEIWTHGETENGEDWCDETEHQRYERPRLQGFAGTAEMRRSERQQMGHIALDKE